MGNDQSTPSRQNSLLRRNTSSQQSVLSRRPTNATTYSRDMNPHGASSIPPEAGASTTSSTTFPSQAPPPYSITEEPGEMVPPPVPPRDRISSVVPAPSPPQAPHPHRRAVSHSHPHSHSHSQQRSGSGGSQTYASPAEGVGGFRAQLGVPHLGSAHTTITTIPADALVGAIPTPPQTPQVGRHNTQISASPPTAAPAAATAAAAPAVAAQPVGAARAPTTHARRGSREDILEMLKKYDTVIIVDDSSSMAGALWFEARDALASLADIAGRYDEDGIDVHFLNDRRQGLGLRTAAEVKRLFDSVEPDGITPTGEKLEELLLDYLLRLEALRDRADAGDTTAMQEIKPVNFIVLTDGAPTDDPESVIVTAARRLDARNFPITQVGIQFVQIGNDPAATEALQELDDDLASTHGIRDIVDTTPYSGQGITGDTLTKILLGGINRRVDRRGYTS